jgi:integrase
VPVADVFTIKKLISFYIKEWAEPRKRSWKEDQRLLNKDIAPIWGERPAESITRGEIIGLLEATLARGPSVSRDLLKVMRRMWNFAIERGRLEVNPCYLVKPLARENVKDRHLAEKEILTFWSQLAASGISDDIQKILKLILITGQRPGEVAGIHRNEIDGGWWTIAADRAKNGRQNRLWLGDLALALLPAGDDWLFPSGGIYDTIQTDTIAKALRRAVTGKGPHNEIDPTIALAAFTPHDLRRTCATQMAALGITQHIIGQVLNHTEQSVTAIYNRYEYDDEKKQALLAWEQRLLEIVGKKE